MDKDSLEKKMKELEELKVKIEKKKKEVEEELAGYRLQYYKIIEEENEKQREDESKNPPDTSFLDSEDWSGFA